MPLASLPKPLGKTEDLRKTHPASREITGCCIIRIPGLSSPVKRWVLYRKFRRNGCLERISGRKCLPVHLVCSPRCKRTDRIDWARNCSMSRLDMMFTESQKSGFGGGKEVASFSGVEKLYNHGNQPCLHNAWLFNYSGKPWLTQKWTRAICNEFYGTEAIDGYGYGQDEDRGTNWSVVCAGIHGTF